MVFLIIILLLILNRCDAITNKINKYDDIKINKYNIKNKYYNPHQLTVPKIDDNNLLLFNCDISNEVKYPSNQEIDVLIDFFNSFGGINWDTNLYCGWVGSISEVNTNPCSWTGITCIESHVINIPSKVTEISFIDGVSNYIIGQLPLSICNLTNLEVLKLSNVGKVYGTIPNDWSKVPNLNTFIIYSKGDRVYDISLSGSFPDSLGYTSLDTFSAVIDMEPAILPSFWGTSLVNMTSFTIWGNNGGLTGLIPESYGNWPKLSVFQLYYLNINGTIPLSFNTANALTEFYLFVVPYIQGPIPNKILCLPLLQTFGISIISSLVPSYDLLQSCTGLRDRSLGNYPSNIFI
jgi:hypothetical protein